MSRDFPLRIRWDSVLWINPNPLDSRLRGNDSIKSTGREANGAITDNFFTFGSEMCASGFCESRFGS